MMKFLSKQNNNMKKMMNVIKKENIDPGRFGL